MTPDQSKNIPSEPVFTGERFIPGKSDPILALEHYHRYFFASRFVEGKRVLDIACGEGYGAALLSAHAKHVLGFDNDGEIIGHARSRYAGRTNLEFRVGKCEELRLPERSVDLAVSFETLEHLEANDQESFLRGLKQCLTQEGVLILSSPEKEIYGKSRSGPNEFHRCELTQEEFENILHRFFKHVHLLGQDPVTVSLIRDLSQPGRSVPKFESGVDFAPDRASGQKAQKPLYFLAFCSDATLPSPLSGDASSVYFEPEAPERSFDLLPWGMGLEKDLGIARERLTALRQEFEDRSAWALSLDARLKEREEYIKTLQHQFEERSAWALRLDEERARLELSIQELESLRSMLDQRLNAITRSYVYRFLSFLGLVPK